MKKIKYLALVMIFSGLLQSCLKDTAFLDVSNTTPVVELPFGGLSNNKISPSNFGTLTTDSTGAFDTVIAINLASPQVLNTDVTVTVVIDTALLRSYNAANGTNFQLLPDSAFTGASNATLKIVIPAGYRIRKIPIKIYPAKMNPSLSYAIPYTITSATATDGSRVLVSGNAGSIFYDFIGNPLAGNYSDVGTRYNYSGTVSYNGGTVPTPVGTVACPITKSASVISSTVVAVDYANLGGSGWQYNITYVAGSPATIQVAANATMLAGISPGTFNVYTQTYDPVNKIIHIVSSYVNGSGNERIVDETLTLQ